ncbi:MULTISPECIES: HlyD family secretion protein [Rhodopseudomonas]|uniref:Hemolysin D n=1 Tax=Rhodopseudomonas palustris TaxID=1076 RepID=A0A0D7EH93_RHOPL|nr:MULTISPECIES: HlyD family secretion protein [Rhodopseudomonas]KIZ38892.1 hemolysin D [Rhodopseudomonas palustris]MDF3812849.1 HlyD family secretion protein [Rhodopseudomonas sp. BAL398]WOK18303.1 HlyD family secretion protein [Rhodopseudomonas sp. BAL398]
MAGRDQTARIRRPEPDVDGNVVAEADSLAHAELLREQPHDEPAAPRGPVAPAAEPAAPAADEITAPTAAAPKSGRRKWILIGLGIVAALAVVAYGVDYMLVGRFLIGTDDAYVRANNTTLGARVSGHIEAIGVGDNVEVHAGDVVFRIDDGDYRIAVNSARARIATQQATIERIGRQVTAQQSAVEQAKAQLTSADAAAKRAGLDFDRQQSLSTKGFASRATFELSQATRDQSAAAVVAAQAAFAAARDNVEVTKAQQGEARAQLLELQSALAKAERDLDFTTVRAPVDGVFSNRLVNIGDFIQAGQRLGNVVPLDDVYIDANFKETQLRRLKPGQKVDISVDAFSSRAIEGTVESLSPASGSVFTLLPPDNATGNFTKIVQRVPVRISVPAAVARENMLRAGMSVYVRVHTKP